MLNCIDEQSAIALALPNLSRFMADWVRFGLELYRQQHAIGAAQRFEVNMRVAGGLVESAQVSRVLGRRDVPDVEASRL